MKQLLLLAGLLAPPWLASVTAQEANPTAAQPAAKAAPATLRTTAEVRLLAPDVAAEGVPVQVEGVVTLVDTDGTVFFQQDGAGTHFRDPKTTATFKPGDRVEVTGVTFPGLYIPGIRPTNVRSLGTAALPAPVRVTSEELAAGKYHYTWVEIEGIGRSLTSTGDDSATLVLGCGPRQLEVRIQQAPPENIQLVDARLRVRGLAAGLINHRRQLVSPYLKLSGFNDLEVVEPPPVEPFDVPMTPVANLLRFDPAGQAGHRVKVHGVVTMPHLGDMFFIRDGDEALLIRSQLSEPLSPGDEVEVLGFPEMGPFRAYLADAIYRRHAGTARPLPRTPADADPLGGDLDADLVTLSGELLAVNDTLDGQVLTLQGAHLVFRARCPHHRENIPIGSRLAVTGICRVVGSTERGYSIKPLSFEVWTRTSGDVRVFYLPSWWTTERLIAALAVLIVAVVVAVGWVASLRRQVQKQTTIIHEQSARQAVQDERQRIAREVHDTLEQELVGLSLRLDAAATVAEPAQAEVLETTRRLAGRMQQEVRNLVWDLRDSDDSPRGLLESLDQLAEHLRTSTAVNIQVSQTGEPWRLPALVQHNVFRIVQEAITNSLKHAQPKCVSVALSFSESQLQVAVGDDGQGFDNASAVVAKPGHFGLMGMRERARKVGAQLNVTSSATGGTTVTLTIPRSEANRQPS